MDFHTFKLKFRQNFDKVIMLGHVYVTDVSKDDIWNTYLTAFPEEEQQPHNCNSCRQFLKPYANIVVCDDSLQLHSIWDFECEAPFKDVVSALHQLVMSAEIRDIFVTDTKKLGTDFNFETDEKNVVTKWEHFYATVDTPIYVNPRSLTRSLSSDISSLDGLRGAARSNQNVLLNSLTNFTLDAVDTVNDLIKQNSIYRGQEHLKVVRGFLTLKSEFDLLPESKRGLYAWKKSRETSLTVTKIKSSAIGTLIENLSGAMELNLAVSKYEAMVAPANYKRPTSLVSKSMIAKAEADIIELGLVNALKRRHAMIDDIKVTNLLYVNRDVKKAASIFEEMKENAPVNTQKLNKVEEVSAEKFIADILPTAKAIEVLLENKHVNNLMSLIASEDKSAKPLTMWDNEFTWVYNNNMADSVKERVKAAGGNVDAFLRVSLSWFNFDDLDIHIKEPNGNRVYFGIKGQLTSCGGRLDVDMNAGSGESRESVENIVYTDKMKAGKYEVLVHQYEKRENADVGFQIDYEHDGVLTKLNYDMAVTGYVSVGHITKKGKEITFTPAPNMKVNSAGVSKDVWDIKTNQFRKVSMIMKSPNHWDGKKVGNEHLFFMLEGAKNPDKARGFFNEYLKPELKNHRKVFEILGDKMKVDPSDNQLSGVGFSSTQKNEVTVKVTGNFDRIVKVKF